MVGLNYKRRWDKSGLVTGWMTVVLMAMVQLVSAQSNTASFSEISFKPVPGSLSETSVTTIVQDYQGFLWFGTRNGLNRYDGLQFLTYEHLHSDSSSLSNGYIAILYEDGEQNLWVGTWSGGLNRYDRARDAFIHFVHDPLDTTSLSNSRVHTIFEDHKNRLWVGTENGLNLFDSKTGSFTRFFHSASDPYSLSNNQVRHILEDRHGNLWIGTYGGGLNRFEPESKRFFHHQFDATDESSISNNYIRSTFLDADGDLWVGTLEGLNLLLDGSSFRFRRFFHDLNKDNSLPHNIVSAINQDDSGRLWFGTENGGLAIYDKRKEQFFNFHYNPLDNSSIQSNSIWALFKDNVGAMWMGSFNSELVTWNRYQSKFRHYYVVPSGNSLSNNNVTSFVEDFKGNLWIGTDGGGLNYYNRETGTYQHFLHDPTDPKSLGSNAVISLMEDADHNIWIGTWGGGLNRFNAQSGTFTRFKHDIELPNSIGSDYIFTMLIDSRGRFWVGSFFSSLDLFDPQTGHFQHFKPQANNTNSLSDNRVFKILEDSKQDIWVGTEGGGLNLLQWKEDEPARFIQYRHRADDSTSLAGDVILSMLEDSQGRLWVGTYGDGLSKFNYEKQAFTNYRKQEGLHNQVIDGILEDEEGNLWLSTNNGLSRFNPKDETFKKYDDSDGLQSKEFIRGSCYKTSEGELLFGGLNGYNAFFPEEVSDNPFIPPVYITDFRIFNQSIRPGSDSPLPQNITETRKIVLPYDQNVFSFEISALNYTQSGKNQFAYQLEGYDKDWQYTGTRRNAYYTQVPPGHYTFRAKATNNNGIWNEEGTAIELIITPPWYRTRWAYALYALVLLALFQWYRQNLIRRERLKSELQIEQLELTKMRELDRIKSNFFANIAHEFRTPLALIQGPLQAIYAGTYRGEVQRQFQIMLRNSEKLLNLINQLLDLSKLGVGSMKLEARKQDIIRFLKPIISSFSSYAAAQHIHLEYHHPDQEISVYFDEEKLEQVMNNLLSNALKFTPERGTVTVNIRILPQESNNPKWVEIEVHDTGIGIPQEAIGNIFNRFFQINNHQVHDHRGSGIGLSLTKELVELHQGEIHVNSVVDQGSTFSVRLPMGHQHLSIPTSLSEKPSKKDKATNGHTDSLNLPLVLIVDDDDDFRAYVAEHLEINYRLEEARNGREAFELAIETQPNLIISDVIMAEMNGLDLCRQIKTDERTSHIPVIMITGRAATEHQIEGLETGADYYIVKPFNSKLLELRVRNIIRSREMFQQQLAENQQFSLEPQEVKLIPADKKLLEDALACIERNMDNSDFTVQAFSKELAMSRMQLYRKLKALTNQTPNDFIRTIRLKRAAQLIKQNEMTIAEVTYSVGFNDLQYFRDCFKKQFGANPSKYLDKH